MKIRPRHRVMCAGNMRRTNAARVLKTHRLDCFAGFCRKVAGVAERGENVDMSSSDSSTIRVRVDGNCGTIVLARPSRCNALSRSMLADLQEALGDLHQEYRVRAVVITGQGPYFSAGSDLHEIHATQGQDDPQATWFADANQLRELLTSMLQYPKPLIAAVNGAALGTGLALVSACDIVLAAPEAEFGFPESQRGLTAGIAIPLMSFRIGAGQAAPLVLRSQTISAERAMQIGLVHELVQHDLLWARANQWTQEIASASPVAVTLNKRVLNETVGEALISSLASAAAATATGRTTDAAREGVAAFVEKRPPRW